MNIQPINSIECALLHNRFSPMSDIKLFESISRRALNAGFLDRCVSEKSDDPNVLEYSIGTYRITISQINSALSPEGFGGCLPQPITLMMMPDAEQRVLRHTAHTFISISRNIFAQVATSDSSESEEVGDFVSSKESLQAMTLGYYIADALHRNNPASAFHWLPSDHLVPPQIFESASSGATLTSFFVRPYLYSSAGSIGDNNPVGLVANGSQYMLPKPVIFEEAQVSYEWMIKRSIQFIDQAIKKPELLESGSGFGITEGEVIEVIDKGPEPANPMGSYTLVVRSAPEFGIRGGLQSVLFDGALEAEEEAPANHKLDENDPIDQAILIALRERAQEMKDPAVLPSVKDRRMQPRETHEGASFGKRGVFGKR